MTKTENAFHLRRDIRRLLTFPVLVDALEAGHRRPKKEVQDGFLGSETEQYFVRHAVDPGRLMGSKLITSSSHLDLMTAEVIHKLAR